MNRRITAILFGLVTLVIAACDSQPTELSIRPQFSGMAEACKNGGYADYTRTDGSGFKNQGDCVSYVARGGTLVPVASEPPVIHSFTLNSSADYGFPCTFDLSFSFSGGSGVIDNGVGAVTSGVDVHVVPTNPTPYTWTLTVTNSQGVSVTATASRLFPGGELGCPNSGL